MDETQERWLLLIVSIEWTEQRKYRGSIRVAGTLFAYEAELAIVDAVDVGRGLEPCFYPSLITLVKGDSPIALSTEEQTFFEEILSMASLSEQQQVSSHPAIYEAQMRLSSKPTVRDMLNHPKFGCNLG